MSTKKRKKSNKIIIGIGAAMILLSVPVYFLTKFLACSGCRELSCAFCDTGAAAVGVAVAVLGLISIIVGIVENRKSHRQSSVSSGQTQKTSGTKHIILEIIRWFFIVAFLAIGGLFAYFATSTRYFSNTFELIIAITCLGAGILLIFLRTH